MVIFGPPTPVWHEVVPMLVVFGPAFAFAAALLQGIACARDEPHRLTPLDAWVFFWRGFWRRAVRNSVGGVPWLAYGCWMLLDGPIPYLDDTPPIEGWIEPAHALIFWTAFFWGPSAVCFAVCVMMAPRFKSVWALGGLGGLCGLAACALARYSVDHFSWLLPPTHNEMMFYSLLAFASLGTLPAAVWFVRSILDHAWFRFDA